MPKYYKISKTNKDLNGAVETVTTQGGMIKPKRQVIRDINNGFNVETIDKRGRTAKVMNIDGHSGKYIRTIPNNRKSDNLSNL